MSQDFKAATDVLLGSLSHEELAKELGVSVPSVRQARLEPAAKAFRRPPDGWEVTVARLAIRRAKSLQKLSNALQKAVLISRKNKTDKDTNRLSSKK